MLAFYVRTTKPYASELINPTPYTFYIIISMGTSTIIIGTITSTHIIGVCLCII